MARIERTRVRAPELLGRRWLNTGGRPIRLGDLRGRFVLLDFWTFCCVNCLHVLDELRPVEERYADALVIVGVHSPKFEHEKDPDAVAAAVERYGVAHPVLDDPELSTWQQYAARAWPTLVLIDPTGYVVATMAGEGHADGLDRLLAELVAEHEAAGTLVRAAGPYVPPPPAPTELRYPGKALALPGGTVLVADSARHRLVEQTADGTILRRIGSGRRGRADGPPEAAEFSEPQGMALLPREVADTTGYDVVVADTVNHLLRGVRLDDGTVRTVAGTGRAWLPGAPTASTSARALEVDLSSPWDVAWYTGEPAPGVVVAMAGVHQLWWFDPVAGTARGYAGTTTESLRDGPLADAFLAQPSGLAADGDRLWLVDSESSALRYVERGELHTVAGTGLFDFGHVDGKGTGAMFQHPLGVATGPGGVVLVADTYNGALRRYDPASGEVTTLATGLAEPSDVVVVDGPGTRDGAAGHGAAGHGAAGHGAAGHGAAGDGFAGDGVAGYDVLVVESGAHRVTRPLLSERPEPAAGRYRTERPVTPVAAETVLDVVFETPPGAKLDDTYGPPTRLEVSANPPDLLVEGAGVGTDLSRRLVLSGSVGGGVLQVTAQAATCDVDGDSPACHLTRQDWGVPVELAPDAPDRLPLVLRGTA